MEMTRRRSGSIESAGSELFQYTSDRVLVLTLLGSFAAECQDRSGTSFSSSGAVPGLLHRAILAYLVMQPNMTASRDALAALFWPDATVVKAKQNLRQGLLRLRQSLLTMGLDVLISNNLAVALRETHVRCDARQLLSLCASGDTEDLQEGFDLFRGSFLSDVTLAHAEFDQWRRAEARRIENSARVAGHQIIRDGIAHGFAAQALDAAQKLVDIDPFAEEAQQQLLRVLWRFQGRMAALRQAERLTRFLRAELDCAPDPETQRLVQEINNSVDASHAVEVSRAVLTEGPSIAVMPFVKLDTNPATEVFADGLTEEITTALSRLRWLFVIASSSVYAFRGRDMSSQRVSAKLGVRYLLEGSVRTEGKQLRLIVKLVNAQNGSNIWVQSYNQEFRQVFDVQDDITEHVSATIEPGIYRHEGSIINHKPDEDLTAWEKIVRSLALLNSFDREGNKEARALLTSAVATAPKSARAHALLAWSHYWVQHTSSGPDIAPSMQLAKHHAQLAVTCDHDEPWAQAVHGFVQSSHGVHDEGIAALKAALNLNPNFALARMLLGWAQIRAGHTDEAIEQTRRALRLSPTDAFLSIYKATHGLALLAAHRFEEALPFLRQSITPFPEYMGNCNVLISCCGHLGLLDEAKRLLAYREATLGHPMTIENASR
jgi:adenylate cyclase